MTQETTDAQPFPAAVHQPCADTFSTSEEEETMEVREETRGNIAKLIRMLASLACFHDTALVR